VPSVVTPPTEGQYDDGMGLFDKRAPGKRKDDFDSPVEQIDLGAAAPPAPVTQPAASGAPSVVVDAAASESPPSRPSPAAAPPPSRPLQIPRDEPDYGIEKAIELMRTLPQGNVELVVQVVKFTLESAQIKIGGIIDDASSRQDRIQSRISVLRAEIADHEQEIAQRKSEIGTLEADYSETTTVKERLQLAEQLTKAEAAARPQRATGPQAPVSSSSSGAAAPAGTKSSATGSQSAVAASASPAATAPANVKK
jgi:hypothetical protein